MAHILLMYYSFFYLNSVVPYYFCTDLRQKWDYLSNWVLSHIRPSLGQTNSPPDNSVNEKILRYIKHCYKNIRK